jgi:hypothetical protein
MNIMKITKSQNWFYALSLAFGLWTRTQGQDKPAPHELKVEDQALVTATATVQALNLQKRELTLQNPLGDVFTVTVDKAVKRLDEIHRGDKVTTKYYISVAAELRDPTEEEKKNPIMVTEGTTKAPKEASPAAASLKVTKVVATVEGIERPTRMLTLKGPNGNYHSVRARDVKRLEQLHLGDTIVVTFTEAYAIAVEKN